MAEEGEAPPTESKIAKFKKHWFVELVLLCAVVAVAAAQLEDHFAVQPRINEIEGLRKQIEQRNFEFEKRQKEMTPKPAPQPSIATPPLRPSSKGPVIKFGNEPIPSDNPGWQGVIVTVKPPPSSTEKLQVWIKQGDENWYPCNPPKQVSAATPDSWMAMCRFGNPDSPRAQDRATPGMPFTLGAFCWKEEITGTPTGLPAGVWNAFQFKLQKSDPIIYRGK